MADLNPVDAMTKPLSPAAQAVLDAYGDFELEPADGDAMAAALRAVAEQLAYTDSEGRQFVHVPEILAIATELEADQ